MRHRVTGKNLGRSASHRRSTIGSLCTALFLHKRVTTTVTKAKESRRAAEKLITTARGNDHNAYREVFKSIRHKDAIKALFTEVVPKIGQRPGGYTRVVKLGQRRGDGAEMAVLELVDFNLTESPAPKPKKTEKSVPATAGA